MALTFAGINRIDVVGGGILKAYWAAATGGTVDSYNIYIRKANSTVFGALFLLRKVDSAVLNTFIRMEADAITFLRNGNTYHIGIKAEEASVEDSNTQTISADPLGDGSLPLEVKERPIAKVI